LTAGTGVSVSGGPITASGAITVTNTAPDQVVVLTGTGGTSVTGTYPNFTISSAAGGSGTVTSIDVSGGTTGLTTSGGPVTTSGTITFAGTLNVANGGTGATTLSSGYLLKGNGTSAVSASVVYDTGTDVGIGTASPSGRLAVKSAPGSVGFNTGTSTSPERGNLWYDTDNTGWKFNIGKLVGSTFTPQMTFQDDGNIGIGTALPGSKLDVNGTIWARASAGAIGMDVIGRSADNGGQIRFLNNTASAVLGTLATYGNDVALLNNTSSFSLLLGTNSTERMRIDSSGNVGIGTTSPSAKLSVQVGAGNYILDLVNGSEPAFALRTYNHGTGSAPGLAFTNGLYYNTTENAAIKFYRGGGGTGGYLGFTAGAGTEYMTLTGTGNVGIGTATPQSLLELSADLGPTVNLRRSGSADGNGVIRSIGSSGTVNSAIEFGGGLSNLMSFYTNGSERMRINSSGNLALGLSTSPYRAVIYEPSSNTDVLTIANIGITVSDVKNFVGLNFQDNNGSVNGTGNMSAIRSFSNLYQAWGTDLTFWTTGSAGFGMSERMRITPSGNVGIGTSSPTNSAGYSTLSLNGSTGGQLVFQTGGAYRQTIYSSSTDLNILNGQAGNLTFGTNNAERMRIDSAGNVGIGTTTPASYPFGGKLNVAGSISMSLGERLGWAITDAFTLNGVTTAHYGFTYGGSTNFVTMSGYFGVNFATLGSERMRITGAGNVRIGTGATDVSALSISRDSSTASVSASSSIVLSNRNTSLNGTIAGGIFVDTYRDVRDPHYSGGIWFTRNQEVSNLSSSSDIVFGAMASWDTGLPTERMRINSAGDVLIGTTSDASLTSFSGAAIGQVIQSALPLLALVDNSDTTNFVTWLGNNEGTGFLQTKGAHPLNLGANSTTQITITSAGNVGIGTGSPGQKLTVNGTIETTSGGVKYPDGTTQTTGALEKVDVFSTVGSTTWTKPSWATSVEVILIGGGQGGGGGRRGAAGTARNGGGGGNGGTYTTVTFPASLLTTTVTVAVGGGGAGGAAATTDNTDGGVGGNGGASSFGTYAYAAATRTPSTHNSPGPNTQGSFFGSQGSFGSGGGTVISVTASQFPMGPSGGAGGGQIAATNVVGGGGQGANTAHGTIPAWRSGVTPVPAGNFNTGAGPSGTDLSTSIWYGGESGSGGGASSSGNAFAGGNGGKWGGGGGGGGASLNGVGNSGAGGNGGDGLVVVISRG
jgi:hypothetical protein